jgi:hypothetical protein
MLFYKNHTAAAVSGTGVNRFITGLLSTITAKQLAGI